MVMPNLFDRKLATRMITGTHEFWYRLTGGWVGGNILGTPILLLETKGRKSGRVRTTPLLYLRDGDDMVVVASYGGSDHDPDWWRNLADDPQATVQVMSDRTPVRAQRASATEKERLWPRLTRMYPQYDAYQRRTSRDIPVVILRPQGNGAGSDSAS